MCRLDEIVRDLGVHPDSVEALNHLSEFIWFVAEEFVFCFDGI